MVVHFLLFFCCIFINNSIWQSQSASIEQTFALRKTKISDIVHIVERLGMAIFDNAFVQCIHFVEYELPTVKSATRPLLFFHLRAGVPSPTRIESDKEDE